MIRALTAVSGFRVGHWTALDRATGCTVVLAPPSGALGAVFVRGRATGSRELDALRPDHLVGHAHAVLLTGGSAFGLGAADGVMRWLRRRGIGFAVGNAGVVPIVPTAVIFDLAIGSSEHWPTADDAETACHAAGTAVEEGSVGAGTGATVGKTLGPVGMMKGGLGTWAVAAGDLVVGALAVVNPFGDVRDHGGAILAGARRPDGSLADSVHLLARGERPTTSYSRPGPNSTLAIVATNARLDRQGLFETARMAGDALARHVTPVGTAFDGDMVFALTTSAVPVAEPLQVELLAQEALGEALVRGVRHARGLAGVPGCADQT